MTRSSDISKKSFKLVFPGTCAYFSNIHPDIFDLLVLYFVLDYCWTLAFPSSRLGFMLKKNVWLLSFPGMKWQYACIYLCSYETFSSDSIEKSDENWSHIKKIRFVWSFYIELFLRKYFMSMEIDVKMILLTF